MTLVVTACHLDRLFKIKNLLWTLHPIYIQIATICITPKKETVSGIFFSDVSKETELLEGLFWFNKL